MTKTKGVLIGVLIAAVLIGGLVVLSYGTLPAEDPVKAVLGPMRVLLADTEHVVVSESPKVIVAKPGASLDEYMWENGGYLPVPEKQLGAIVVYRNADAEVKIHYSVNGYFSKWEWQQ